MQSCAVEHYRPNCSNLTYDYGTVDCISPQGDTLVGFGTVLNQVQNVYNDFGQHDTCDKSLGKQVRQTGTGKQVPVPANRYQSP